MMQSAPRDLQELIERGSTALELVRAAVAEADAKDASRCSKAPDIDNFIHCSAVLRPPPITGATTAAEASEAPSPTAAPHSNYTFGDTVTYKDGLAITVSAPTPYTPSSTAAGVDQAANIQFTITVKNGTTKNYDPVLFPTVSSNGVEGSSISDIENKVGFPPSTAVPAGGSISYVAAFSVADPSKLVFDINPGFAYAEAVFQN